MCLGVLFFGLFLFVVIDLVWFGLFGFLLFLTARPNFSPLVMFFSFFRFKHLSKGAFRYLSSLFLWGQSGPDLTSTPVVYFYVHE